MHDTIQNITCTGALTRTVPLDPYEPPAGYAVGFLTEPAPDIYIGEFPAVYVVDHHITNRGRIDAANNLIGFPEGEHGELRVIIIEATSNTTYPQNSHVVIGKGALFTLPVHGSRPHRLIGVRPVADGDFVLDLTGLEDARVELGFYR